MCYRESACNFQRQFEFVQRTYCIKRYFSCVLPSLASFVQDYVTAVTLAPLQWQKMWAGLKQVKGGSLRCCLLALMSFNEMLSRTEPRKERTKCPCHLKLTWTAAPLGKDLPAVWTAEQKERMNGTIKENLCLLDSCRPSLQWWRKSTRVKNWSVFVGKRLLILVIPNFLRSSLKSIKMQ